MEYAIREFCITDNRDAERLAEMWNASDKGWPGGWTRGIPDTAQRVLDRKRQMDGLAMYVVEREGKIVGYGDLTAQAGQKRLAYVSLLNVQPEHQGKSLGRRLILALLDKTIELGYEQLSINTWPGNTQAVPLYKKTGFFWVPETTVYLQNYLPQILSLPITRAFFDHNNWYECFKRDLAVSPDEITWNGCKVFPYKFEANKEKLTFIVDSKAEGITALETNSVSVECVVGAEEVPVGLEQPVRWNVKNKGGEPIRVTLIAGGEEGISLSIFENFVVKDEATVDRTFVVAPDIKAKKPGQPAHRINSTIIVNGIPLSLLSAVVPVQPVEIRCTRQRLMPEKSTLVRVNLRNRLSFPVGGKLTIERCPELDVDRHQADFTVEQKSWSSCAFWVQTRHTGSLRMAMRAAGEGRRGDKTVAFTTKTTVAHIRSAPLGKTVATVDDEQESVVLESDSRQLRVERSGSFSLQDRILDRQYCTWPMPELGPPFVEWRHIPPSYAYQLREDDGQITLVAPSDTIAGMVVETTVTFTGSPAVQVQSRVINNADIAQKLKLKCRFWDGDTRGRLTIPTKEGLLHQVVGGWGSFPEGETDVSKDPQDYPETWIASEREGVVQGVIWSACEEIAIEWGLSLQFDLPEIPAHSFFELDPVYVVAGHGKWELVRTYWRWLHQSDSIFENRRPTTYPVLEARFAQEPLLVSQQQVSTVLTVRNNRGKRLQAKVRTDVTGDQVFAMGDVDRDNPFAADVEFTLNTDKPGVKTVGIAMETEGQTETFAPHIVILGDTSVPHTEVVGDDLQIDNGAIKYTVDPSFLGSIRSLVWKGAEQLQSAYPKARPYVWLNPWFGGVHPFLNWVGDSKLSKEQFRGDLVERKGAGKKWYGVRVVTDFTDKDRCWLRLQTEYLTTGESNVVAVVIRCVNKTEACHELTPGLAAWLQPGGSPQQTIVHYEQQEPEHGQAFATDEYCMRRMRRGRGDYHVEIACKRWAAIENPEHQSVVCLVSSWQPANIEIMDFGDDGAHVFTTGRMLLHPNQELEMLDWLVLCESLEEARKYETLSEIWKLT